MADSFTPLLRLNKQEVGAKDGVWAPDMNTGVIQLIDDAISGKADITANGGTMVLTTVNGATDSSRPAILRVTGTPGSSTNIEVPSLSKFYVVYNGSDASITVKTNAGAGTSVNVGQSILMMVDDVLDDVFPVMLSGSAVLEAAAWKTGTFRNVARTAGTEFVNYRYSSQGGNVMILIPAFSFTCSLNTWTMQSTSPSTSWPDEILVDVDYVAPVWATDNGNLFPAVFSIDKGGSGWKLNPNQVDPYGWTSLTVRAVVRNIHVFYGGVQ